MRENKKQLIRKKITRTLREQGPELRSRKSRAITNKIIASEQFERSGTVMVYVSLPTEVDTTEIIKEAWERGKRVAVPFIEEKDRKMLKVSELSSFEDLTSGLMGTKQPSDELIKPIPDKEIDLVLVPAIAFDRQNNRLGRGGGHYDRFLASTELDAFTAGLAFRCQIVDDLPKDPHDIAVDLVISE